MRLRSEGRGRPFLEESLRGSRKVPPGAARAQATVGRWPGCGRNRRVTCARGPGRPCEAGRFPAPAAAGGWSGRASPRHLSCARTEPLSEGPALGSECTCCGRLESLSFWTRFLLPGSLCWGACSWCWALGSGRSCDPLQSFPEAPRTGLVWTSGRCLSAFGAGRGGG